MENDKIMSLIKIPLQPLLEILSDMYDRGASFIDISGVPDQVQDMLMIIVRQEYLIDDHTFEDIPEIFAMDKSIEEIFDDELDEDDMEDLT